MTGRMDIVAGQGHGSPFSPQVRVFSWSCSPLPCGFKAAASFDAYPGLAVGVSVGTGNFDTADTMDEIITGLGPVSAAGSDLVKIWNADGTPALRYSFNAWGGNTWGTNVGSAEGLESGTQAGRDTPVVGKGPGDQFPVYPSYSTIMDEDIRLFRHRILSDAYTAEVTIDDPWVGFAEPWIAIPGAFAGARATGFQADADPEEEIAVVRGPVNLGSKHHYQQPPGFRGSVLAAFDIDTTGATWAYDTVAVWSTVVFPDDEPAGQPSTKGLQVARLRSTADLKGQYAFRPERVPMASGDSSGAEPPVDPSKGARTMAEEDLATFACAAEGLFEDPRWKPALLERLGARRDDMASGATASALARAADLDSWLPGAVRNAGTEAELVDRARRLRKAIEQQIANRPPVPVLEDPPPVHDVPWGEPLRVAVSASRSTDPDSTPGTSDNIVSYRWYHEGRLVGEGADAVVELSHDGVSPISSHTVLLELEDAYGGRATAAQVVLLRGLGVAP